MNSVKWLPVVGYEGSYEVSNTGEVRTDANKVTYTKHHGIRRWRQRSLKPKTCKGRDFRVDLWMNGKPKTFLIHRLVALAFLPKVEGKNSINHKDGNPKNNHVSNLEWCDHKDNNNHAFDNDLMSSNKKVILVDNLTGEEHYFRSMSKANIFLGRSITIYQLN
ncbi:NUMOD4 domain-containing protein [Bacillus cereus]